MSDQAPALRPPPPPPADSDYDSILAAVMETARGRWFLQEYAQRNRNADTGALLTAIGRIESLLQAKPEVPADPADAGTIARVHRDIAGVLDALIECGAPSFLCNDLARHLKTLAALGAPAAAAPAMPAPAEPLTEPVAEPAAAPPRDPFADIRALSPEEKIALFT